jgi:hypothetical protein
VAVVVAAAVVAHRLVVVLVVAEQAVAEEVLALVRVVRIQVVVVAVSVAKHPLQMVDPESLLWRILIHSQRLLLRVVRPAFLLAADTEFTSGPVLGLLRFKA